MEVIMRKMLCRCSIIVFLVMITISPISSFSSVNKPITLNIKSVKNLSISITAGEKLIFPNKIKTLMSNGSTKDQNITWKVKAVDTKVPGSYKFYSSIKFLFLATVLRR